MCGDHVRRSLGSYSPSQDGSSRNIHGRLADALHYAHVCLPHLTPGSKLNAAVQTASMTVRCVT